MKSGNKAERGISKSMLKRMLAVLICLCVVLGGATTASLFYTMVIKRDFYRAKAAEQQLYDREIAAKRGNIYDRNKNLIAASASVWTLYAMPKTLAATEPDKAKRNGIIGDIAENISKILDADADEIKAALSKDSGYVVLAKKIEQQDADAIREYISDSEYGLNRYLGLDEGSKRFYANSSLASVVLGFVGDDGQGLGGIELQYDDELTGTPGRVIAAKQANGNDMPFTEEKTVEAKPGNSLILTIDSYIQSVCEKYLEQGITEHKVAERAVAVCMNVNTGEILAMAVKGDYDLNDPFALSEEDSAVADKLTGDERTAKITELRNRQWRNKAVSDVYDPGSVFKIVTAAAALEENVTDDTKSYFCSGSITVGGRTYHCSNQSGHGRQNLTQAMQNSCNPAFITLGQLLGVEKFSKYFEAFGLTEKTGIDLPGEADPIYYKAEDMGVTQLASASFGQSFNITPIQLVTAVSAAVNGGKLVKPYVVSEIVDSDGKTVSKTSPVVKRQAVSEKTSEKIRYLMEKDVDGSNGRAPYVQGFRIGGKTGTSEKLAKMNETGQKGLYIASFCGVAPINDPEIAILMLFDEPHGDSYYGSMVAAPPCGKILEEILPYLGHDPVSATAKK